MRAIPLIGVAALALGACQAEDTAANNDAEVTTITEDEGGATDPALTDLNMDANPNEVDQAINQTDSQSELDRALEDTANSVGNEI